MKVMMINALDGLRGRPSRALGRLPASVGEAALVAFSEAVAPIDRAFERVQAAAQAHAVPDTVTAALQNRYDQLSNAIADHTISFDENVNNESDLAVWTSRAEDLASGVASYVAEVDRILGRELRLSPARLVFVALGSTLLLGGAAALFVVHQRKRKRRRRRRSRKGRRRR
jgi:hypothetical protein